MNLLQVINKIDEPVPNKSVPVEFRKKAEKLMYKYQNLYEGLGSVKGEVTLEIDVNVKPTIEPPRRVPLALHEISVVGRVKNLQEAAVDHLKNLEALQRRLEENNIKLNKDKTLFSQQEVLFFGHILSSKGIRADPEKIKAIRELPPPKNREDLQRILGMIKYMSKFIPNLSTENSVLRNLNRDDVEFEWTNKEQMILNNLKEIIAESKVSKFLELGKPITLETDASRKGLGAVLYQDNKPVYYASPTLRPAEENYAVIELEMKAIAFGCGRFDTFLVGNPNVIVYTDHKALEGIFN